MIWQQEPELVLWFVSTSGNLIGLTYDRANGTVGWHEHPLGGTATVESIQPYQVVQKIKFIYQLKEQLIVLQ